MLKTSYFQIHRHNHHNHHSQHHHRLKGKVANAKSSCIVAIKNAALDVDCIALPFQWNLDNGNDDELYVIMMFRNQSRWVCDDGR